MRDIDMAEEVDVEFRLHGRLLASEVYLIAAVTTRNIN
jgi:hypothetical protein